MTSLAQTERAALCDTALQVGEDQPTLCEGWDVKDLVVHLLVRERSVGAVGIAVPKLEPLTERAMRRIGRRDFTVLVEQLRNGPPRLSLYGLPKADELLNSLEYFVHHEDIRRAQPDWTARTLGDDVEKQLWAMTKTAGKGLTRNLSVGVTAENSTTGSRVALSTGNGEVVVKGLPSEVLEYLFGRKTHADVDLLGDDEAIAALSDTALGF
jgi:uncharacterized protein (TIGR03085 family)